MSSIQATIDGKHVEISDELIEKYDRPLPRYTSYPPTPVWGKCSSSEYESELGALSKERVSLYVHVPFCDLKCSFCGCHSIATSDAEIKKRYVRACCLEIRCIAEKLGDGAALGQIHFGGGTPASIGMEGVGLIMDEARGNFKVGDDAEIGIEIDPRVVAINDIGEFSNIGFNRISIGVQDFNSLVSKSIGRISDPRLVASLFHAARAAGMTGINYDLMYGLPNQTPASWSETLDAVVRQHPDRIAVFNFAYLPSVLKHQRKLDAQALPSPRTKLELFIASIEHFERAGYEYIGLDHFVDSGDALASAHREGRLTRNFQGYAAGRGMPLVGIGVTSISETGRAYMQNEVRLLRYLERVEARELPTARGIWLTRDDEMRRFVIRNIMCNQRLDKAEFARDWGVDFDATFPEALNRLSGLKDDGFVEMTKNEIEITPLGRLFIREAAAAFDASLGKKSAPYSRGV